MPSPTVRTHAEAPADWGSFARSHGSFYHEPAWIRGLSACFGFPATYLTAHAGGALAGLLPLLEVPTLLGRRRMVSLPFSYAAGPAVAASDTDSAATVESLYDAAWDVARGRGARRVEIKRVAPPEAAPRAFVRVSRYATYRVAAAGEDVIWRQLHTSTQRSVRKARKAGVEVTRGTAPDEWTMMAELQERTSHRLGVPAPPRRFFVELCGGLQRAGLADLLLARLRGGSPIAGIVLWLGARERVYAFGASLPEFLEYRPNHLLIWSAAEDAARAGVIFDLGRAAPEQKGLVEFKLRWGADPVPLAYDYRPAAAGLNVAPRDRGPLAAAARIWAALPGGLARRGAFLYRYLG